MKYTFNVPRAAIESTRRAIQSPAFQEALNLRELVGYLGADRHAAVETAPALLLTDLSVSSQGAAVATLEPLGTLEARIVERLHDRLDPDEYVMTLARDRFTGRPTGVDFSLASDVTRATVRREAEALTDARAMAERNRRMGGGDPSMSVARL